MSGGVGLYSDYTSTILCIVVKKKWIKLQKQQQQQQQQIWKWLNFCNIWNLHSNLGKSFSPNYLEVYVSRKIILSAFLYHFFFSKECSVCFWSYFLFFHNINCTRHERQEKAKKGIKKYKWLNLHSRHTFLMKAAEYISIRRYIDSLLQSVKLI